MATLLYRVSAKVDKITGLTEVLVRFFHGDLDQRAKTNIFIDPSHWDKKAQRNIIPRIRVMSPENKKVVETLSYQNTCLNSLEQFIHQEFINSGGGKAKHPDTWLADTIDKFYAPEPERKTSLQMKNKSRISSRYSSTSLTLVVHQNPARSI